MSLTLEYDPAITSSIVTHHDARPELLVQVLHDVVERFGYVPDDAIRQLANELNLSRAEVHGVVSFYHDFRTDPPGKHRIKICQAESCQAMGSRQLTAHAESALGIALNETGDDITLEAVYCLGNCACSPAVMVDGRTYGKVDSERFDELLGTLGDDA